MDGWTLLTFAWYFVFLPRRARTSSIFLAPAASLAWLCRQPWTSCRSARPSSSSQPCVKSSPRHPLIAAPADALAMCAAPSTELSLCCYYISLIIMNFVSRTARIVPRRGRFVVICCFKSVEVFNLLFFLFFFLFLSSHFGHDGLVDYFTNENGRSIHGFPDTPLKGAGWSW
jgi:hypothetical protein